MWPWLIGIGQWAVRLIGGWLPFVTKPFPEWLGKVLWCAGIAFVVVFTWNRFTRPTTDSRTTQKAGVINNYTERPTVAFGCIRWDAMNGMKP